MPGQPSTNDEGVRLAGTCAHLADERKADDIVVLDRFDRAFKDLPIGPHSYVVIITRGHSHDKTVLAQALKTSAGYIGMIGSRRKRDTIYRQLLGEGYAQSEIDRVHSPIAALR